MVEQIMSICGNDFDGTLTMLEFPESRPKTNEKAKLIGTFDGVM